jgi:methylated-DNA-protein-cysteine methyltransferase related protein
MATSETTDTRPSWLEQVFRIVRCIPYGKVTTYGSIAEAVGSRTTSRMVGWAMNKSHLVLPKVPAHRVVNRKGILTGKHHFGHPDLMQQLLESEGICIQNDKIISFNMHYWNPNEIKLS